MCRGLLVWLVIVPKLALVAVRFGVAKSGLFVRLKRFRPELHLHSFADLKGLRQRQIHVIGVIHAQIAELRREGTEILRKLCALDTVLNCVVSNAWFMSSAL